MWVKSLVETSTHYLMVLKEWVKECVSYFRIESLGTLGSLDIFGPANHPAVKAMIFHVVRSFTAINCMWNERVSYRCLTMNLYSFVSITRHNFLSINPIVVLKEFWRFFETVRGFYINSAPESNQLCWCVLICAYYVFDVKYPLCISGVLQCFFVLLQSDNEFKGTKFATFMAELKRGALSKLLHVTYNTLWEQRSHIYVLPSPFGKWNSNSILLYTWNPCMCTFEVSLHEKKKQTII